MILHSKTIVLNAHLLRNAIKKLKDMVAKYFDCTHKPPRFLPKAFEIGSPCPPDMHHNRQESAIRPLSEGHHIFHRRDWASNNF
jgi:hypothetical protein